MPCLLETKDPRNGDCVRTVIGSISLCGPVPTETDRGTECLKLKNLVGYTVNKKTCETRLCPTNPGIIEYVRAAGAAHTPLSLTHSAIFFALDPPPKPDTT